MLYKIKHNLTVLAAKKLLDSNKNKSLSTAKRVVSILAGAYIVQRGLRAITKRPVIAVQEAILGGFLIYDAMKDIKNTYPVLPKVPAQIRRNQIQGNDPSSGIAEFV
jgi:uncharacterized membrane protein